MTRVPASTDSGEPVFRPAARADLPDIVRMLADDVLGATREEYASPLPAAYGDAFADKARPDAIRFYQSLGFVASHEGLKLAVADPRAS